MNKKIPDSKIDRQDPEIQTLEKAIKDNKNTTAEISSSVAVYL